MILGCQLALNAAVEKGGGGRPVDSAYNRYRVIHSSKFGMVTQCFLGYAHDTHFRSLG